MLHTRKSWAIFHKARTEYDERHCSAELVLYYHVRHCIQYLSPQYGFLVYSQFRPQTKSFMRSLRALGIDLCSRALCKGPCVLYQRLQCDSVTVWQCVLDTCYFLFPLLHALGMRLCIHFTGFMGHRLHFHVMLQVSLVHITTECLKQHKLSTEQQLQNCEDTLTSLCSQQSCMLLWSFYKKGPSFFNKPVQCFSYGAMTLMSNPSQLYQEVRDSKIQFSSSQILHQLIVNNL